MRSSLLFSNVSESYVDSNCQAYAIFAILFCVTVKQATLIPPFLKNILHFSTHDFPAFSAGELRRMEKRGLCLFAFCCFLLA